MTIDLKTFCVAPFVHQSTKTDGSIKACCRSTPQLANINEQTLEQAWNCEEIRKLRLDSVSGRVDHRCRICFDQEAAGVVSLRQKYNAPGARFDRAVRIASEMGEDGRIDAKPTWLEFKLSNLCNLKCRMCHPMDSTKWFDDWKAVSHFHEPGWDDYIRRLGLLDKPSLVSYDDSFFSSLADHLSDVTYLQFAGGEPLYDDNHYRVLDMVMPRAKDVSLCYATNLTVLATKKYNVLDYWKNFKHVLVAVSIDGPPGLNEYIRGGTENYDMVSNLRAVRQLPNVTLVGKVTIQALNIWYLPETLEWFESQPFHEMDFHFVNHPRFLDCRIWPKAPRDAILAKLKENLEGASAERKHVRKTLSNAISYFEHTDLHTDELWQRFKDYNATLDRVRYQSLEDYGFLKTWMM